MEGVADGDYLLLVEAAGFPALSQPVTLAGAEVRKESVTLALGSLRTAVQVTAASAPLQLDEIAKAGESISAQEVRDRDEFSIAEAVRLLPGVRMSQLGGPGNLISIQVRGLRSQDTAVLFDGLRIRDAADPQGSASPFLEVLNTMDTASVEVLRGSGSSLYGSHAIGGVINIRGEEGGGPWRGQLLTEGGGLGLLRGVARASGSIGDRLLLSAGVGHLNVRDGVAGANPHRNTNGQGFARWLITPSMSLSGRVTGITAWTRPTDSPVVALEQTANLPATGIIRAIPLPDDQLLRLERGLPVNYGNSNYVPAPNDPDYSRPATIRNYSAIFRHELSPLASWRVSYQGLDSQRRFDDGPAGNSYEPVFSNRSRFDGRIHLLQARRCPAASHQSLTFFLSGAGAIRGSNSDENRSPRPRQRQHHRESIIQFYAAQTSLSCSTARCASPFPDVCSSLHGYSALRRSHLALPGNGGHLPVSPARAHRRYRGGLPDFPERHQIARARGERLSRALFLRALRQLLFLRKL